MLNETDTDQIMLYYEAIQLAWSINNRIREFEPLGNKWMMHRLLRIGEKAWKRVERRKKKAHASV